MLFLYPKLVFQDYSEHFHSILKLHNLPSLILFSLCLAHILSRRIVWDHFCLFFSKLCEYCSTIYHFSHLNAWQSERVLIFLLSTRRWTADQQLGTCIVAASLILLGAPCWGPLCSLMYLYSRPRRCTDNYREKLLEWVINRVTPEEKRLKT